MIPLLLLACARLPAHEVHPNTAAALSAVLEARPKVLGIGELHVTTADPGRTSTLSRFTSELLPVLAPRTTDLALETWRVDPSCFAAVEVSAAVQEGTHRPPETKSELVLLVERAIELGVRPHDLVFACEEYARLTDEAGEVRYGELLSLVTARLQALAIEGLETPDATLVLYGGAVHNDVTPPERTAAWSYGRALHERGGAAYVELDLLDPAALRAKPDLIEPGWAALLDHTGPDRALLHPRGPQSWVLLLPEGAQRPSSSP